MLSDITENAKRFPNILGIHFVNSVKTEGGLRSFTQYLKTMINDAVFLFLSFYKKGDK